MKRDKAIIGWREWLHLPDLGVRWVKAKVDTGARTSALHADQIETFRRAGRDMVRFVVHPVQRSKRRAVKATAELLDMRAVRSSNGKSETRPVIETAIDVGGDLWVAELTLTKRDVMGFRMLLGRQAIRGHALVDPGKSYLKRNKKPRATKPVSGREPRPRRPGKPDRR